MSPRVLALLPVYNEERFVGNVLERMKPVLEAGVVDEAVVVDDGSTDGTAAILGRQSHVTVLSHPSNRGCGDAIRTAYRYALDRDYDVVVIMAGNGKDDPAEIGKLVAPIRRGEADYVQGSRFLPGGHSERLPLHRRVAIKLFTYTFSFMLMKRYTDCTNGFRAYRASLLQDERVEWDQAWLGHSYAIEFYVHYKAGVLGYRVEEVPVSKIYPAGGSDYSKVRLRDWINNLKPLFLLRFGLKH